MPAGSLLNHLLGCGQTLVVLLSPAGGGPPATGDRVWPMPMYDEYKEDIKSDMAEVKNAGSRMGGVSSSAKFLEHFTEDYPWAHLDIAYMALQGKGKPGQPKGASGYGVQLLASLAAAI
ncbi:MAG: hypothetical protein F4Y37_07675 [Caldilineaceae bacterium SB0664_bin_22]|nr:hypothetical protein [Caldilineaceae bacterium SB0664_bin_22]